MLLLDADNLPLANPERLFESEEYRHTGALFFPDWWDAGGWMRPAAYTLFGLTPPWLLEGGSDFKTSESGQMLFNRWASPSHGPQTPGWMTQITQQMSILPISCLSMLK